MIEYVYYINSKNKTLYLLQTLCFYRIWVVKHFASAHAPGPWVWPRPACDLPYVEHSLPLQKRHPINIMIKLFCNLPENFLFHSRDLDQFLIILLFICKITLGLLILWWIRHKINIVFACIKMGLEYIECV